MTLFSWIGRFFSGDAQYNHELYKSGRANKNEVRSTTVGWRPDPIGKQDGYTQDESFSTPSRNENGEYYIVTRSKKGSS